MSRPSSPLAQTPATQSRRRALADAYASDYYDVLAYLRGGASIDIRRRAGHLCWKDKYVLGNSELFPLQHRDGRLCPPPDQINSAIQVVHESGHLGIKKTYSVVSQRYYGITQDQVAAYIKRCVRCAERRSVPSGNACVTPIKSSTPFERLVVDLKDFREITPQRGPRYCLSFVDHFTGFVVAFPIFTKRKEEVWQKFLILIADKGYPKIVHSDNGGEFQCFEDHKAECGFETAHSLPHNPRVQGKVERWNRTCSEWVAALHADDPSTPWWIHLYVAVGMQNYSRHSITRHIPAKALYRMKPRPPVLPPSARRLLLNDPIAMRGVDGIPTLSKWTLFDPAPSEREDHTQNHPAENDRTRSFDAVVPLGDDFEPEDLSFAGAFASSCDSSDVEDALQGPHLEINYGETAELDTGEEDYSDGETAQLHLDIRKKATIMNAKVVNRTTPSRQRWLTPGTRVLLKNRKRTKYQPRYDRRGTVVGEDNGSYIVDFDGTLVNIVDFDDGERGKYNPRFLKVVYENQLVMQALPSGDSPSPLPSNAESESISNILMNDSEALEEPPLKRAKLTYSSLEDHERPPRDWGNSEARCNFNKLVKCLPAKRCRQPSRVGARVQGLFIQNGQEMLFPGTVVEMSELRFAKIAFDDGEVALMPPDEYFFI